MTARADYLSGLETQFGRIGVWIATHRLITIFVLGLFIAGAGYFAGQLRIDNSFDTFFDETDEAYQAYKTYQRDFGSDEVAYILYSASDREHGLFDLELMRQIVSLTEALEYEVPFVREVTSLTNVEFIEATDDLLEIHEIGLDFPETQEAMLERRDAMRKKPIYYGGLFNEGLTHASIVLEMDRASTEPEERLRVDPDGGNALSNLYPQASQYKIEEILARPEYDGIDFYMSGDVTMNTAYNVVIGNESVLLTVLSLILVALISMVCFRLRLNGLLGPITVVLLGLFFTLGFMGAAGFNMGTMFLIVPTLLIAIGVAQSVHLIEEFNTLLARGTDRLEAIRLTYERVGVPCMLAAVTTAIGFFAMSISKLQALSDVATYMSFGVLMTFILSITVIPLFLSVGKNSASSAPSTSARDRMGAALARVAVFAADRRHLILAVFALIFIVSFAGIARLHIGFNFLTEFKEHVEFRKDTQVIEDVMGGMLNVVYIFDSGAENGIKDPEVLQKLERLQLKADEHPLVKKSYSIVDILKDINQSFNADDATFYRLPDDGPTIAQYLLLYEISGGKELADYVTFDQSRTSLELRVEIGDSALIEQLIADLDRIKNDDQAQAATVQTTGIGLLWVRVATYIADSQLWGYLFAFSMIAVILVIAYRSLSVGMWAMIPNLSPVILTLGYMGWAGIHLDYFRLLLATIAIGIAVDDTVHMTTRLRREFLRLGDYRQAIANSVTSVGRALVITTVVLTLSFLVYLVSEMSVLASFGILLAFTISVALIADLLLLSAIVLTFKPFGKESAAR